MKSHSSHRSPGAEARKSPMPKARKSPVPELRKSPVPKARKSPMPEVRKSPVPEARKSPMPKARKSPVPELRKSLKPEEAGRYQVFVQEEDFDPGALLAQLGDGGCHVGAIASFVGVLKGHTAAGIPLLGMTIEHYPSMTEKSLRTILQEAHQRWAIHGGLIVHRFGRLTPGDRIVLVAISSVHREAAFQACHFVMDYLKTQAPFWKKEETAAGAHWVAARASDTAAAERWQQHPTT